MKQLLLALSVALVFLMAGEASGPPQDAEALVPPGLTITKSCTSATVAIGGTTTCTIIIEANLFGCCFPGNLVLTVQPQLTGNGPNNTYGRVIMTNASTAIAFGPSIGPPVTSNPADGSPQTMTIPCTGGGGGNVCDFFPGDQIIITEVLQGAVGGVVTQSLSFSGAPAELLTQTVRVLPSAVGATLVCAPLSIVANSGAGGQATCTATFSDSDIFSGTVSSGNVNVTLTGLTGAVLTATGAATGNLRCGTQNNMPQGCTTLPFGVQSNALATGNVGAQLTYTPDLASVDNQYSNTFANVLAVTAAAAGPVPNTPAQLTVAGPASIACGATGNVTATLRDAGGTLVAAPTQVGFNSTLGVIASPVMTNAGVATTTLAAPATGAGGNALITATSGALTAQTLVPLAACAGAPAVASVSVSGPTVAVACGTVGTITATLRDSGGALMTAPTQVNFTTSAGVIASPVTTVNGVATTTLAAPSTGTGGTAVVTATGAGVTSQAVVALGACTATTTTLPATPTVPYLPYIQPIMPYYPPAPAYVPPPPAQPVQPIINIYNVLPTPVAQAITQPQPGPQGVSVSKPVAPATFRPPNTGDAGLAAE